MDIYREYLNAINNEHDTMLEKLISWSHINSHSRNLDGLNKMLNLIKAEFESLAQDCQLKIEIKELTLEKEKVINNQGEFQELELGKALNIRKISSEAKYKVFLGGHMDTVFPIDSPFQKTKYIDNKTLNGPGVADLKGGLLVMINALKTLEKSPWAQSISWEVLINPDEEIGSPGSAILFTDIAQRNDLGLIYEPSLPDGSLAYKRKGAGNFTAVIKGKAAHVGRAFDEGRSAMVAAAELIQKAHALNSKYEDIILNTGSVEGGGPSNVVPELAIVHMNIRIEKPDNIPIVEQEFEQIKNELSQDGITVKIHGSFGRAPKVPDEKTAKLYQTLVDCGKELGIEISKRNTGGCCDGNNLFAAGLANIDTLGVRGANIHSDKEFILLDSLVERTKLSALLLMKLGNEECF